jgi:hypothetical protein
MDTLPASQIHHFQSVVPQRRHKQPLTTGIRGHVIDAAFHARERNRALDLQWFGGSPDERGQSGKQQLAEKLHGAGTASTVMPTQLEPLPAVHP